MLTDDIANILVEKVKELNMDELEQNIKQCSEFSTTNCWWVTYALKDIVREVCKNHWDFLAEEDYINKTVL